MQIYLKLFFTLLIVLSDNKIQSMHQLTGAQSICDYDYEMYNYLDSREFFETGVDNTQMSSVYDVYFDSSYIPKITPSSYQNQRTAHDNEESVKSETSYYDFLTQNVEIIEKKEEKQIEPLVVQTKLDRILSSVINNSDHGMQAAIDLMLTGAKVNDQDNPTKTSPLHFAAQYNAYKLGAILITQGANINSQDINGQTPLHLLAIYSNDADNEFAKILLYAGADLYIKDNDGKTAAKIALELEYMNLYNLILDTTRLRLIS